MKMHLVCPYVRDPTKFSFEYLIDTEAQKKWFSTTAKHRFWDSLEYYVFDYLLNIEFILDEPHKAIGQSMYDEEEAYTISKYLNCPLLQPVHKYHYTIHIHSLLPILKFQNDHSLLHYCKPPYPIYNHFP